MATYFGITSDYANSFFSGMMNKSSSSTGSTSGLTFLSDYASIKNGSYKKLLNAYYAKNKDASTTTVNGKEVDSKKTLAVLKTDAEALKESAEALYKGDLFKETELKDEKTGEVTKGYDYNKIAEALESFAEDYNTMVEAGGDSKTSSVLSSTSGLTKMTAANAKLLGKVGITINTDNTLSVDKEQVKKADIADLKTMFSGSGSYAYQAATKASMIYNGANSAAVTAKMYNSAGAYSYMTTGDLYNGLY